jgi:hypothetical protein
VIVSDTAKSKKINKSNKKDKTKKNVKRQSRPVLHNKGQRINKWDEDRMKMAIEE